VLDPCPPLPPPLRNTPAFLPLLHRTLLYPPETPRSRSVPRPSSLRNKQKVVTHIASDRETRRTLHTLPRRPASGMSRVLSIRPARIHASPSRPAAFQRRGLEEVLRRVLKGVHGEVFPIRDDTQGQRVCRRSFVATLTTAWRRCCTRKTFSRTDPPPSARPGDKTRGSHSTPRLSGARRLWGSQSTR
jgi:hypothetical protein